MKIIGILVVIVVVALGGYYLLIGKSEEVVEHFNEEDMVVEEIDFNNLFSRIEDISSMKYRVTRTSSAGVFNVMHYQKGSKMRIEFEEDGKMVIIIIDSDNNLYYGINTSSNVAAELTEERLEGITSGFLQSRAEFLMEKDLREVGREILDNKNTIIVEFEENGQIFTTWVWEEHGIPIKSSFYVEGIGEVVAEVSSIEFVDIDDDMFVLSEEIEITETEPFVINPIFIPKE